MRLKSAVRLSAALNGCGAVDLRNSVAAVLCCRTQASWMLSSSLQLQSCLACRHEFHRNLLKQLQCHVFPLPWETCCIKNCGLFAHVLCACEIAVRVLITTLLCPYDQHTDCCTGVFLYSTWPSWEPALLQQHVCLLVLSCFYCCEVVAFPLCELVLCHQACALLVAPGQARTGHSKSYGKKSQKKFLHCDLLLVQLNTEGIVCFFLKNVISQVTVVPNLGCVPAGCEFS